MPISFTCPHCGKQSEVADKYAGQTGPCSGCGQTITIPCGAGQTPFLAAPSAPSPVAKGTGMGVVWVVVAVVCLVLLVPCTGILVALLLPAVQSAREAARRSQCNNNLKQIAIAFQCYHDAHNTFPPAYIPDKDGRPMHSWRVLILPFMEQQALYAQYNFNEPWDSPRNQLVTSTVIPTYKCPSAPDRPTETNYMVITGPGTLFEGAEACSIAKISDGTSNTILVVEVAGTGVNWAEPRDLDASKFSPPFSPPRPDAPGSHHTAGLNVVLGDCSTRFLSNSIDPATAQGLTTRAGGERIQPY
jgi:hypothetical protein